MVGSGRNRFQVLIRYVPIWKRASEEKARRTFRRFLIYLRGPARETGGWYKRLRHWTPVEIADELATLADEIGRILTSLINTLPRPD